MRGRLATGGLFCQWLPLHQLDVETLRSIVQSFIAVYPGGRAILASNSLETPVLGLVGQTDDGQLFDIGRLRVRLTGSARPDSPATFGIDDELALLGSFIAGPKALASFAGSAVANTDDQPVVAYRAPHIAYLPDSLPQDRLNALLDELSITPDEVMLANGDASWAQRLAAYWAARKRYIAVGRNVRPSANPQDMLSQVREPLLSVLRISPDFRPAYEPLVRMATFLGRDDAPAARALLAELVQIQPTRPEAGLALRQLAGEAP